MAPIDNAWGAHCAVCNRLLGLLPGSISAILIDALTSVKSCSEHSGRPLSRNLQLSNEACTSSPMTTAPP